MLHLHIDIKVKFVILLQKSAKMGVKMTKNSTDFRAEAAQRNRVAQNEKDIRAGKLVRIGDGDYLATPDEVTELKADLLAAGFELAVAGAKCDERIYMPDCRTIVSLTRIQHEEAAPVQAPAAAKAQAPVQQQEAAARPQRFLEAAPN